MEYGAYTIEFDRTGFPLIRKKNWRWSISLFPVSKYQFEHFMADCGTAGALYTDKWYRSLLAGNPRRSWRKCSERPWELFLTGGQINDLAKFFKYLGNGFGLPELGQWQELLDVRLNPALLSELCESKSCAPPIPVWIRHNLYPLAQEGLLEMVQQAGEQKCVGRPWQGLLSNTWSPEIPREVNWQVCARAVGFRVVRKDI